MPSATVAISLSCPDAPPKAATIALAYKAVGGPGRLSLTGAGTYVVDLAMMPTRGLLGLLVQTEAVDDAGAAITTPVSLHWTEAATPAVKSLGPGGSLLIADPNAVASITALSIVYTAAAIVHVIALG